MYLHFHQVVLIQHGVVREWRGERVLTTDNEPSIYTGPAVAYGHLYYDARDRPCVVPMRWDEQDANIAGEAIYG